MVTLGLRATSPESQNARQISVMKKILEERSKMFSHDVWGDLRARTSYYFDEGGGLRQRFLEKFGFC